jgi:hypothetical protein
VTAVWVTSKWLQWTPQRCSATRQQCKAGWQHNTSPYKKTDGNTLWAPGQPQCRYAQRPHPNQSLSPWTNVKLGYYNDNRISFSTAELAMRLEPTGIVRDSVFGASSSVTNGFGLLATRQLQSHWIYIVHEARKPKSGSNKSQAGIQAPSKCQQKHQVFDLY